MRKITGFKGFTMIELMIVAVAIGIFSAIAIPRFGKVMTKLKLKSAARDVTSTLRLARSNSVSQKRPFGVYFDVQNGQYILFEDKVNLSSYTYEVGDSAIQTANLPENVDFGYASFNNSTVIFRPNGSASSSGMVDVWSYDVYDYLWVDVLASTGRVKLVKQSYEAYY
ncbi:MAG: GspH/FimT family pseudopilin [Candidatus Zixiibacteriota bacterium]